MPFVKFDALRILIVEDQMPIRLTLHIMLKELGITNVVDANDGKQAMEIINENSDINLILCDWNMPNMSGAEFLKHIRSKDHNFPFIMITARGDLDSVLEAKAANVTAYILKPFSLDDLKDKLTKVAPSIKRFSSSAV